MQILVCDDNPRIAKSLATLVKQQVCSQGISATVSIVDSTNDLHHLICHIDSCFSLILIITFLFSFSLP